MKQRKKHVDLNSMTKKQLIDEIKSLNEEIMNLKNKFQSRNQNLEANPIPIATQTTLLDEELTFPCQLCIYNADSEMDLRVHMDYAHDLDDDDLLSKFKCKVCNNICKGKQHLMNHIKVVHGDTLPNCKFYQNDSCKFNEKSCWYVHKKDVVGELKCRYCEQIFYSKSDVMFHQKKDHIDKIPICKNHVHAKCKYKIKCWYTHPAIESNDANMSNNEKGQ